MSIEFDEASIGDWENAGDRTRIRVDRGELKSYKVTYTSPSGPVILTGFLTRLGEGRVLDLTAGRPPDPVALFIPAHVAVRVQVHSDALTVSGLDYSWFLHEIEQGRLTKLRPALDNRKKVVLTADTAGFRAWLAAQSCDGEVFGDATRFVRKARQSRANRSSPTLRQWPRTRKLESCDPGNGSATISCPARILPIPPARSPGAFMHQRRLRLGDVLDDYCPRERRVTNHVIVAMIEDEIKQTRCSTCDTEHEFKKGKMPTLRRKKDAVSTAYKEVLAGVTAEGPAQVKPPAPPGEEVRAAASLPSPAQPPLPQSAPEAEPLETMDDHEGPENGAGEGGDTDEGEAGRVHRRLIRATLPRPENHQVTRPVPEFTMRQPTGRPGKFRGGVPRGMGSRPGGGGRGAGNANGNSHSPVFGRPAGSRGGGGVQGGRMSGRNEVHRQPRSGQPVRHGKKHSK